MSIDDDWALASKILTLGEYSKKSVRADGTVEEITLEGLRLEGTVGDIEALEKLVGMKEAEKIIVAAQKEQVPSEQTPKRPEAAPEQDEDKPLLSEYTELFLKRKEGSGKPFKPATARGYRNDFNLFIEIFGDLPVEQYLERDALNFREILRQLPPKVRQSSRWKELTINEILDSDTVVDTLNESTIKDKLTRLNAIFLDLADRREIKFNIFKDVTIAVAPSGGYQPFEHHELCNIFDRDNLPVDESWPSHYWVPIIGLYTGMRRSEIFFRTPSDIRREGKIDYIYIHREGEKNTKNKSSVRKIPIHSHLIKLGFLDYVQTVRDKSGDDAQLFPEYKNHRGQAGNKFSDWFGDYKASIGINDAWKVFHSFRSNFINELEKHDCNSYHIQRLAGHSVQSITHNAKTGYGGKFPVKDLKKTIEKLNFQTALLALPRWVV